MKRVATLKGLFLMAALLIVAACGGDGSSSSSKVLYFGGIPDQNATTLVRRYDSFAEYMSEQLGVEVKYIPSVDYAAVVTGFKGGDLQLAWFGGLTGVQARLAVPDSEAIAQRPRDAEFHSKFIVQADLGVNSLEDLKGFTFTFGSESSTSGHLMPRHFLVQAGIDPDKDFKGGANYSGSHDKTWKLVESGAFQAGALNEAVWERAVQEGKVDLSKVRVFFTTPAYFDYNWTIRGDADETFGEGFTDRVREALLAIGPEQREILGLFSTDGFIETSNDNYQAIQEVAEQLGIVR
ncbi:MAG: putative selenate ABC transporter substrate-binding protein [Dehalococcoidia bacterium]